MSKKSDSNKLYIRKEKKAFYGVEGRRMLRDRTLLGNPDDRRIAGHQQGHHHNSLSRRGTAVEVQIL